MMIYNYNWKPSAGMRHEKNYSASRDVDDDGDDFEIFSAILFYVRWIREMLINTMWSGMIDDFSSMRFVIGSIAITLELSWYF